MLIRPAQLDDAAALLEIYNPVVLTSTATFDLIPRTLDEQREWLSDRAGARIVLVAIDESDSGLPEVAGFSSLSPYRDRAAYATTVEDSVYVHPDHHGRGVGRLLLTELIENARLHGFHAMMARIVSGHEASIGLHTACGFEIVGHEREVGRKFHRWLDVTLMQLLL